MLRLCVCLAAVLLLAAGACRSSAAAAPKWTLGDPIVTYWAGPGGFLPVIDRTVAQLAAGGWNLGWTQNPSDLDLYHRHGLRAMLIVGTPNVDDPAQAAKLEALVKSVRTHPALYAYYIVDEPGAGAFPMLGKLVSFLREKDPAHLAYINLLPTYASAGQLQVSDDAAAKAKVGYPQDFMGVNSDDQTALRYREHLRQFISVVKPSLISYDHYHFMKNADGGQYFLNIALIREAALKAKLPFLNIVQTCDSPAEGWRGPNENEVRWLTYTTLAYGAQGISHFRYDTGLWKDPAEATAPLPLYWSVSRMNREFVAIAKQLQPLRSLGVYHCGSIPLGGVPLPADSPFVPEPRSQEVLIGLFGMRKDRPTHAVVVNLDYKKPAALKLTGPGDLEALQPLAGTWKTSPTSKRITLDLEPGGGALVRLKR